MKRLVLTTLAVLSLAFAGTSMAFATQGDDHKVGICHRTASDTNPYVYIEVDVASLSPGHLDNADPGHKPTFWKSDGTFRGVAHVDGDPKDDYLAPGGAGDCEDFPSTQPSDSPTSEPSVTPTVEPSVAPSTEPTAKPKPSHGPSATLPNTSTTGATEPYADASRQSWIGLSAALIAVACGLYLLARPTPTSRKRNK